EIGRSLYSRCSKLPVNIHRPGLYAKLSKRRAGVPDSLPWRGPSMSGVGGSMVEALANALLLFALCCRAVVDIRRVATPPRVKGPSHASLTSSHHIHPRVRRHAFRIFAERDDTSARSRASSPRR